MAKNQFKLKITRFPQRGTIYDRNLRPIAYSIPRLMVYQYLDSVVDYYGILKYLKIKDNTNSKLPKLLSDDVPIEYRKFIISPKERGLFAIKYYKRLYPFFEISQNLVGFVSDMDGMEGLERSLDMYLKGSVGYEEVFQSADGKRFYIPYSNKNEPKRGLDVITTIDMKIQNIAYNHLKNAVISEGANWGFVIVADPQSGEILAMANYPNSYKNYSIQYMYEPGSTFKIFTFAKALELNLISDSDSVFVNRDGILVDGYRIKNVEKTSGYITYGEALSYSINSAFAKLGITMGGNELYEIARRVGFGIRTDVLLNGETNGILKRRYKNIDIANFAIGQGFSINGLQMVMAYSCIANGGYLVVPRIILKIGDTLYSNRIVVRKCFSSDISNKLKLILLDVVERGSGKLAKMDNIKVAGKTGTSQKFLDGSYSDDKVITSFIGFFPVEYPKYLIYVVLDEPKFNKFGGTSAAPVFKRIARDILKYQTLKF
ncbi:MAG: penicillin-binding protein 2 [candidate division WOR-3 bacterium]|nr:penicillin-binding protein 2 [candidate division WOR-3 bacterium]MDW8150553.1 penicillin-binding protein 2 [candidate division WOR-3 bacterium]